jgi:hypothetical protein
VSVSAAASLLSPRDVADIHQLQLDGLATQLSLGAIALVLYRLDADGVPQPQPSVTVARRWANRQAQARGSEAAAATDVAGDLRAYAPWDVAPGDTFVLDGQACRIVPAITAKDGIVTANFALDQGSP